VLLRPEVAVSFAGLYPTMPGRCGAQRWRARQNALMPLAPAASGQELSLLLACVGSTTQVPERSVEALLNSDLDWALVVRSALEHGVSPIVAERLLCAPPGSISKDLRVALDLHLQDNRARNVALGAALIELLGALRVHGVEALPFKGPALAALTTGDYTTRRAGDLDLLVRRSDIDETWATLEALGYCEGTAFEIGRQMTANERRNALRYQCEYALLRERDRVWVEPHWAVAPPTMAIDLNYARMWERTCRVEIAGRSVPTLGHDDLLPVLCIHGSKHGWTRLQWIADIGALIERFTELDLPAILEDMRARGLLRMTLLGLELARRVLGTSLPEAASAAIAVDREVARLAQTIADRLFVARKAPSIWQVNRLHCDMRERRIDRIRYLLRTALTPTEKHYRMCDLPGALSWLYVPLKVGHDYVALPLHRAWKHSRSAEQS
jgi:hypothetical protein